jgi:hypothetical protein
MAASITSTATTVVAAGSLSASRLATLAFTLREAADPTTVHVFIGQSASPPAVFSDLLHRTTGLDYASFDNVSIRRNLTSGFDILFPLFSFAPSNSGMVSGTDAYVCTFASDTPSAGDAPLAVSNAMPVGA